MDAATVVSAFSAFCERAAHPISFVLGLESAKKLRAEIDEFILRNEPVIEEVRDGVDAVAGVAELIPSVAPAAAAVDHLVNKVADVLKAEGNVPSMVTPRYASPFGRFSLRSLLDESRDVSITPQAVVVSLVSQVSHGQAI